jgi:hypothetical protein
LLVRAAGIPARVALGYTPGARQGDGTRLITSHDAHAWVEVYFAGLGWVPFDPTPLGIGRAVTLPWAPRADSVNTPATATSGATAATATAALGSAKLDKGTPYVPLNLPTERPAWVTPVISVGAGLLALLLLGSLPWLVRRRRRRRALTDGGAAALWDELQAIARDLGIPEQPSATPRQTARRLAERVRGAAPGTESGAATGAGPGSRVRRPDSADAAVEGIRRLALAEEAASYARPGAAASTSPLAPALRSAHRGLLHAAPRRTRVRATLWPASVMSGLGERASLGMRRLVGRLAARLPRPGRRATDPA